MCFIFKYIGICKCACMKSTIFYLTLLNYFLCYSYIFCVSLNIYQGRLTVPTPRTTISSGGTNAPVMTCNGPVFGASATSMRCHDSAPGIIKITISMIQ